MVPLVDASNFCWPRLCIKYCIEGVENNPFSAWSRWLLFMFFIHLAKCLNKCGKIVDKYQEQQPNTQNNVSSGAKSKTFWRHRNSFKYVRYVTVVKLKKLLLVFGVCFIPSLASVSASSGVNRVCRERRWKPVFSPKLKHNVIKDSNQSTSLFKCFLIIEWKRAFDEMG